MPTQYETWIDTLSEDDKQKLSLAQKRQQESWQMAIDSGQIKEKVELTDPEDPNSEQISHEYEFSEDNPHKDNPVWTEFNQEYVNWCKVNNLEVVW